MDSVKNRNHSVMSFSRSYCCMQYNRLSQQQLNFLLSLMLPTETLNLMRIWNWKLATKITLVLWSIACSLPMDYYYYYYYWCF